MNTSHTARVRRKVAILLTLGALHAFLTAFCIPPGYLSIDETVYHWATKSLAATGNMDIANGYQEHPSPELVHPFLRAYNGKLQAQYPMLFSFAAVPFYKAAGFYGLFILNSLAFVIVVLLCIGAAKRLFDDIDLALNAALILAGATFAWEYSQAAWPHMASACIAMGVFYLFVHSYFSTNKPAAILYALGAGFIAGFGPGVRYDSTCLIPMVVLPLATSPSIRAGELVAFLAGLVPGLAVSSFINLQRFGVFSPIAEGITSFGPFAVSAAAILLIGVPAILSRPPLLDFVRRNAKAFLGILAVGLVSALCVSSIRTFIGHMIRHAYIMVVDITRFYPDMPRPAMLRGDFGEVIYHGGVKKALLQSLPFLGILVLPITRAFRSGPNSSALRLLFLLPVILVGFCSFTFIPYDTYEGGLCLNLRYFVPILPLLSILCAYSLRQLTERYPIAIGSTTLSLALLCTFLFFVTVIYLTNISLGLLALPLLLLPLILAGSLAILALAAEFRENFMTQTRQDILYVVLCISFVWAGLVAFLYDYPLHRQLRMDNYLVGEMMRKTVPHDSILFTTAIDQSMQVIENDVIVAFPYKDGFKDFVGLLDYNLKSGRRVFALFQDGLWKQLASGPLPQTRYKLAPEFSFRSTTLAEISEVAKPGK